MLDMQYFKSLSFNQLYKPRQSAGRARPHLRNQNSCLCGGHEIMLVEETS